MADQLYLENIDEFVTDQNKIVSSYDWGTRACDRGDLGELSGEVLRHIRKSTGRGGRAVG
ncbi:hypothetical protein P7K49_022319 [Saguinus oedipus]|uniref:Uncharacterized protein n=1 Tax=Saguinus oedipus TaxID=9490 RepID=A0ABQ9UVW9_SAGOE|nr:hypothetical protein P7K49_022319 [Saguinus oedipus]